ncbi:MAG: hypothetical protein JST85_18845 [Acidobacteria bacterium]|nr:hypothetical protein [Acidobacteriota bacterium]
MNNHEARNKRLFRIAYAKLSAILLALASCLVFASGPVRANNLPQESSNEILEIIEHKGACLSHLESRRLQNRKKQLIISPQALEELRRLPVLERFHSCPTCFWQVSPPILRGPPA